MPSVDNLAKGATAHKSAPTQEPPAPDAAIATTPAATPEAQPETGNAPAIVVPESLPGRIGLPDQAASDSPTPFETGAPDALPDEILPAATEVGGPAPAPLAAPVATAEPAIKHTASEASSAAQAIDAAKPVLTPADSTMAIRTNDTNPVATPAATAHMPAAPPQSSDPASTRIDMTQAQWAENLVEDITRHSNGSTGTERLTLTLTPERLGTLQIRLEMQDGLTHVHIVTETPEAARAMTDAQHRLADALSRAGLELGSQSTQSGGSGRDPGQSGQSGQPEAETSGTERSTRPEDSAAVDPATPRTGLHATTSINLLA